MKTYNPNSLDATCFTPEQWKQLMRERHERELRRKYRTVRAEWERLAARGRHT